MKILNVLAGGILLSGAIISLQNSANDYGLRTNNLDPNVAAQSDDTSGGGGTIEVLGLKLLDYKKNHTYTVTVEDHSCRPHNNTKNMCDTRQQRIVFISLREGDSTSGDRTNN